MKTSILVLTSTLPRWEGDATPEFVRKLCIEVSKTNKGMDFTILAPHSQGSKIKEVIQSNIIVNRVRYALLERNEKVFYAGGAANKRKGINFYYHSVIYTFILLLKTLVILHKYNAVHAHWLFPQGVVAVLAGKISRRKIIVTVHGGDIFTMNGILGTAMKKFVLRNADIVFVVSEATEKACRALVKRKYTFGPMGVDFRGFSKVRSKKRKKLIFFAGRLSEEKGVKYLINSLKYLEDNYTLEIAGDGPEIQRLKDLVKRLSLTKRVVFHGWLDNGVLSSYISRAEVFVAPSITLENGWREGMGLVYLEALACGIPVVTTMNAGARDFIKEGVNGQIVDEKQPKQISDAIKLICESEFYEKGKFLQSIEIIKSTYSWEECARRYKKVYKI